jgi:hypothetical protein
MMAPPKTGFEKWQVGLSTAAEDEKWNAWDCEIQVAVNEYNRHLSRTAGYRPLDWQIIKAMLWVETGANNPEWKSKPMQIGVAGDPGLGSFLASDEGGDLILPPNLKVRLNMGSARAIPEYNILAGIGYLLMRMANFDYQSVPDADPKVYEVTVKAGDSLYAIAKAQGTTIAELKKLNPTANILRSGQILKYQKASIRRIITSWRQMSTTLIAQRYNGGGDPNYEKKLDYALTLLRKETAALCTR